MKLEGNDNTYAQSVVVDKEGRVFMQISGGGMNSGNTFIVVLDAEGKLLAKVLIKVQPPHGIGPIRALYFQIQWQLSFFPCGQILTIILLLAGLGMNSGNTFIVVLDAEGKLLAKIDTGTDWINAMGLAADGTVLVTRSSGSGTECLEVDLANKSMGKSHAGVPNSYSSSSLISTPDGGLLIHYHRLGIGIVVALQFHSFGDILFHQSIPLRVKFQHME